jgi:nucleoid-associated protein YgaU
MRTDVKVGLICVFAVILAVVIYFVMQGNSHPQPAQGSISTGAAAKSTGSSSSSTPSSGALQVSSPATAPAAASSENPASPSGLPGNMGTLAQATPSGGPGSGVGGPLIPPPSLSSPIGTTTQPSAAAGIGLNGGTPASVVGSTNEVPPTRTTFGGSNNLPGTFGSGNVTSPAEEHGSTIEFGSGRRGGASTVNVLGGGTYSGGTTGMTGIPASPGASAGTATVAHGGSSYKVEKGDILYTIAKKNGVSVKAIENANPGIDANRLKIGQSITIPAASAAPAPSPASAGGSKPTPAAHPTRTAAAASAHPASGGISAKPGASYTVKKGDTLAKIAEGVYGDKKAWRRIFRANRGDIADPDLVPVGTVLRLPI